MKAKINTLGILFLLSISLPVAAQIVTVLHSFSDTPDGANPTRPIFSNGLLFGSTAYGGANGDGMLFLFNTNKSAFTPIYSFNDPRFVGISPNEVAVSGGVIFGTTEYGGLYTNYGTIYSVATNGTSYAVLHSFGGPSDGQYPVGGVVASGGMVYGTTSVGGAGNATNSTDGGTLFAINANGTGYAILHSFTNTPDGSQPQGVLVQAGSTLYGTTTSGGTYGNGTVFAINTSGTDYTILYSFSNAPDAARPYGGLVLNAGTLYGVCSGGGPNRTGAIFAVATNGTGYRLVYGFSGFTGNADGAAPKARLTFANGFLYGTANSGGTGNEGTIFLVNTNGTGFVTLASFTNGAASGIEPLGGVIRLGNALWGTTYLDGPGSYGTLFDLPLPAITTQPQGLTVDNQSPASFTVATADDSPVSYQWYFNNSLLSDQTSQTLSLAAVTTNNAGTYTVVASDGLGSVTSSPALLTVVLPGTAPALTQEPQNVTVAGGGSASFTSAASGTAPLTYQWYFDTNTVLTDQTNSVLTLSDVSAGQDGYYLVVVSNPYGSATSTAAQLTVITTTAPTITQQPQSITVTNGYDAAFTNVASGTSPLFYQWYFNTNTPLAGGTNAILMVPSVTTNQAGYYGVVVSNAAGTVTSAAAKLTVVSTKPIIFEDPQPLSTTNGAAVSFSVAAAGKSPLKYQWYTNSVAASHGVRGATNSTLSFTATNTLALNYLVVVTNSLGRATSSPALLSIITKPVITLNPVSTTVTNGAAASLTAAATGPGVLSYQWLFDTNALVNGATSTSLAFTNTYTTLAGYYALEAANSYGAVTSSYALLTVITQLNFLDFNFSRTDGSASFALADAVGSTNRLWASSNLAHAWFPVATNVMATNGLWFYVDVNSARSNSVRLYRFSTP
jgi:uncharacterized repeat protein (TIGR03803 family)